MIEASPTSHAIYLSETTVAARLLGIQLHSIKVQGPDALESAFETATKEGADALLLLPTVFFALNERRIAVLGPPAASGGKFTVSLLSVN